MIAWVTCCQVGNKIQVMPAEKNTIAEQFVDEQLFDCYFQPFPYSKYQHLKTLFDVSVIPICVTRVHEAKLFRKLSRSTMTRAPYKIGFYQQTLQYNE